MMRWTPIAALALVMLLGGWAIWAAEPDPAVRQLDEARRQKSLDRIDVFMRHYEWCLDEAGYRQRQGGDWWDTFEACLAPMGEAAGGFISRTRNPE